MAVREQSSRVALPIAIALGSCVQLGVAFFVARENASWRFLIAAAATWSFFTFWPRPLAMRRPGVWRATLIVLPPALIFSSPWLAPLAVFLSAFVLFRWRHALVTVRARESRLISAFVAGAAGGAMYAVLLSPRLIDASPSFEPIEAHEVSLFQRILVTRAAGVSRLWLDGQQQLATDDERGYHEALVRPAMSARPKRVLVLGGGDVLAAREALLHDFVESVTIVELDEAVIELVRSTSLSEALGASDARLTIVIDDAIAWLAESTESFDAVIVDFPDPVTPALERLFARETFEAITRRLTPGGVITVQAGSPTTPQVPESIAANARAAGLQVRVYERRALASLGANAFLLASTAPIELTSLTLHVPAQTLSGSPSLRELVS